MPQGVNLRLTGFFHDFGKTRCFDFKEFHKGRDGPPGRPNFIFSARCGTPRLKSPPENYGKEDQTTVAAFLPWRGS